MQKILQMDTDQDNIMPSFDFYLSFPHHSSFGLLIIGLMIEINEMKWYLFYEGFLPIANKTS